VKSAIFALKTHGIMKMMKFLSFALISSSVHANGMVRDIEAKQTQRRTEDGANGYFEYDLSSFSIRFEKCQFVKSYDDEFAQDADYDSVLAMKHFVFYKMCPTDECQSCDGVHGEYVADINDYLEKVVEVEQAQFENMCENCNEKCNNDGDYCSGCGKICYNWQNLENNGYVDASNYIECQQLEKDGDDDGGEEMYIGPMCDSQKGIAIGLFSDENCLEPISDVDVESVLGYKLSYHVLSSVMKEENGDQTCLSCLEGNDNDEDDEDQVNEICEDVYAASAKCESPYGLENGLVNQNREGGDYENQVENEFMSCTFINSLKWNSYTETGEIDIYNEQDEIIREISTAQIVALSGLTIVILALAFCAVYLHHKLGKASRVVGLSNLGDNQVV